MTGWSLYGSSRARKHASRSAETGTLTPLTHLKLLAQFTSIFPVLAYPTQYFLSGQNPVLVKAGFVSAEDFVNVHVPEVVPAP